MADAEVPLQGDRHGHVDGASEGHVHDWVGYLVDHITWGTAGEGTVAKKSAVA